MDFLELAKERFSCRSFLNRKVEDEKIRLILEAGRVAPTAKNLQPQKILVLSEKDELEKLKECTQYGWNAPVVLIVCYDKNMSWKRGEDGAEGGEIDASIVATHIMLETYNIGLGTTLVGSFSPDKIKEIYKLPETFKPVLILPIGYPSEDARPSDNHYSRKELEETIYWDKL